MDKDSYIGRLLDNRYEIQEVIGTGGMAVVYKARCHRLNRLVAIKILKDEYSRDDEFRRRFHAESQAVAMLSHPNIVSVYDVSTANGADYIVMELIDGITLKQYMEKKGTLNWKETLHFAIQIAKALEHAHSRGIVHRDIKPHNVMVLKNGSVKVTDFGIARVMSKSNTLTKEALGSVHYISPEQAKGGRVDNRSDIYSLGVVMYEMMTGRPPYDGESPVAVAIKHINGGAPMPSTLNPNIPGGLEQIIMKAMAHEPNDRYDSATSMLYDMDEFRKEPSILFDYNTPPTDVVTNLQNTIVADAPLVTPPMTTAERVAAGKTEQPRVRRDRPANPQSPSSYSGGTASRSGSPVRPASNGSGYNSGAPRPSGQVSRNTGANARPAGQVSHNTGAQSRPVTSRTPEERRAASASRRREEERNKTATIAIIACSAVAIIAIVVFLVTLFGGGETTTPEMVTVPPFVGQQYSTLEQVEGLQIILQDRKYDETYEAGIVMNQTPAPGDSVAVGTKVYLDVSMGKEPEEKVMPDLTEIDQAQAKSNLDAQGMNLQVLFRNDYSDTVKEGYVTRTDPVKDTVLTEGQIVYVYISQGPEVVKKEVPKVVGKSLQEAVSLLNDQGFKNVDYEEVESDKEWHVVLEQSVNAYSEIDVTTRIVLQVSDNSVKKGTMLNVEGRDIVDAADLLDSKDFTNVRIEYKDSDVTKGQVIEQSVAANTEIELTAEIILTVSNGPKETQPAMPTLVTKQVTFTFGAATTADYEVMISLAGEPVYDGNFSAGEKTVTLTLQGYGTQHFDIYINGQYEKTQKVDFSS